MRTSEPSTLESKAAPHIGRCSEAENQSILDELDQMLRPLTQRIADPEAVGEARRRALAIRPEGDASSPGWLAACTFLAELVARAAYEFQPTRSEISKALVLVGERCGLEPEGVADAVFMLAVRNSRLLLLPPATAVQAELRILFLLAPIAEASFWLWGPDDPVYLAATVGGKRPSRASRVAARQAIFGAPVTQGPRASIHSLAVPCSGEPRGALVMRVRPAEAARARALAEEVAIALEVVLERDRLLERTAAGGRSIVETADRRLRRIGLDLHDGPLQELARLEGDLQVLRHRLLDPAHPPALLLLARELDAVLSLAARLGGGLRDMSLSLGLPPYVRESFKNALGEEVASLMGMGIRASFVVTGDPDSLTDSKKIAITRILEEAISNVRAHSGADEVHVTLTVDRGRVELAIIDNGAGFEVERVLSRAQRRGRLGLVGIRERAGFLGGSFSVDSRPGGPTSVSVTLPEWRPLSAEPTGPSA
jgi:signal transduction histidine kinase